MTLSRRQFLGAAAVAGISGGVRPPLARAIDPIKRPGDKPDLKLSLAAYSFNKDLRAKAMTLFDFIDLAATLPLDAVELTSYYWAEPESDAYLEKLKGYAAGKKLAISGVPVGNNFCLKDDAERRKQIESVKAWTRRAAKVGAQTVRIFAGNQPKGDTLEETQKRVVAAMEECCAVAEKLGVYLALENHGGITDTPEHLLALVKPIKSPALGVNIDTGNFHTADPYADITKIAPYGVVCQVKTEVTPAGKKKEEADLARVIKILKDANFHGYVALEYEAAEDPKVAVPRHVKELRKLISG
jgi:sugar phosphate isomerase/epimerase